MSILLSLDSSQIAGSSSDDFTVNYQTNIELGADKYEVALKRFFGWNTIRNVSASLGNNTCRYSANGGTNYTTITFPDGGYEIEALEAYIHEIMLSAGHYNGLITEPAYLIEFVPNYSTGKLRIEILDANYRLDLSVSTLNVLLGHASAIITASTTGSSAVNITGSVNSWNICCSLVSNSYNNASKSDNLYSFTPSVPPMYSISERESESVYLPVNKQNISQIRIRIVDQLNRRIDLGQEVCGYLLHLRKIRQ